MQSEHARNALGRRERRRELRLQTFAGLIAGGMSAMAYALPCTEDSFPFVAVWYGGTIVLCTLAGAALGPRLLRETCQAASRQRELVTARRFAPNSLLEAHATRFQQ
jgi:hypothetical protein